MIWGYMDRKVSESSAEFMALILGTNLVLVIVISLVFFGQQRYLIYAFGMFYIAYYVLLRKLWNLYLRGKIRQVWEGIRKDNGAQRGKIKRGKRQ